MDRRTVIVVTLVVYKLVLIGIGLWARGRTKKAEDFYLGGRTLGPMVAAISASASSSSAWTLVSVCGTAYAFGLSALWLFPACFGGFLINWLLLAPRLRRYSRETGALTATEVLAGPRSRYQRAIVWTCSLIILFAFMAYVASQFQAAGKAFDRHFGLSMEESVLIGAAIVMFYTLLGGFWAVSVTDTLQGMMMAGAAVLVPVAALVAVGGPAGLAEAIGAVGDAGYTSFTAHREPVLAVGFVLGLLGIGLGYPGQPHVVNRFMALRGGEKDMRRARTIALVWAFVVYSGMLLLGLCARALVDQPGPDALVVADKEKVLFAVTDHVFPPVVAGLVLAAVLSAIMSTADSQLLVAASAITHDLGAGRRGNEPSMLVSRAVVVVLSLGAAGLALTLGSDIFNNVLFAWSAMGAAFGPALLVIAFRGPPRAGATLASILTGFTLSVGAYLLRQHPEWGGPPSDVLAAIERFFSFLAALFVLLIAGRRKAG